MTVSISDLVTNFVGSSSPTTLTTPSVDISTNPNRAGFMGLEFAGGLASTPTSITGSIGGVSAVLVPNTDSGSTLSNARSLILGVTAPPTGSQTGTASWTNAPSFATLGISVTTGVDQTTPFNNGTFAANQVGPASVQITSANGDLTHDSAANNASFTSTNQTQRWNDTSNAGGGASGPGTGTVTHTWSGAGAVDQTISGANFVQVAAVPDSIGSANITSSIGRYIGWTT